MAVLLTDCCVTLLLEVWLLHRHEERLLNLLLFWIIQILQVSSEVVHNHTVVDSR